MMEQTRGILLVVMGVAVCEACGPASSPSEPDVTTSLQAGQPSVTSNAVQAKQAFPIKRILCFGDSLTYGTTLRAADGLSMLSPVEGYVPKLGRLLAQEYGEDIELINSGIGAENTTEGLERLGGEVRRYDPDLVLLLEGAVDIGSNNPPYPKIRRNLADMMRVVLGRDSVVIIGTVPPFHPDGFRISGIDNVPALNGIIRQEAKKQGVPVADHEKAFGDDPGLQGPDGVHPNDNGYEVMAEAVLEAYEHATEIDRRG
ncbi:MAG: SGNH/GDSL hydrolase family protein, partial [Acidobacteriota bacterium]